jgi:ElaA protein
MSYRWQTVPFAELSNNELYTLLRLRQEIFVVEQDCIYQDLDGRDQQAIHMLCWSGTELLAYQRCLEPGVSYAESSIGRIVVAPAGRGTGLGNELVSKGVDYNLERWPTCTIRINAQAYLEAFYTRLGFVAAGDQYDEDGIPHLQMLYQGNL